MEPATKSIRAAWVIPVDQPPIRDGIVTVNGETISSVGPAQSDSRSASPMLDLGDAAIVPGLVNAHTHLEFSQLKEPLGFAGIEFTRWIREVINNRMDSNQVDDDKPFRIRLGLLESFQAGVWCVGDIATTPVTVADYFSQPHFDHADMREIDEVFKFVFYEQLGRNEEQFQEKLKILESFANSASGRGLGCGFSPHAPYSTHPRLVRLICELASPADLPVAMHIAETVAERELLDHQTGPFVELLKDLGVWKQETFLPKTTIHDLLEMLSQAPRSLVIHGNYLSDDEISLIARHRDRMSVVFCPRTHRYFRHQDYPLSKMQNAGVNVAVGTDSRASNPDLNLFEELKTIARRFPAMDWQAILAMGTLNGAIALGVDQQFGSITVGKNAALSVVPLEAGNRPDSIFDEAASCKPVRLNH